MESTNNSPQPDNTAVRTALWRALHLQVDAEPHIFEDAVGLKLVSPDDGWQERPDMKYTQRLRASIIARARFIEDLIIEESSKGISQYVILGAGLDTFAQRRGEIAEKLQIFEIDQSPTLQWKEQRLNELGFGIPEYLHFVPVDFEHASWWDELCKIGFDPERPAILVCTGVTLYLTTETILEMLKQISLLASGSTIAITFYLPMHLLDDEDRPMQEIADKGARAAGTPFISFFSVDEIMDMAQEAGLKNIRTVSTKDMEERYFAGRSDNLLPASGEVFLVATT